MPLTAREMRLWGWSISHLHRSGERTCTPFPEATVLKTKDVKLSTLLREFNAIKNPYPNSAAIVLRTIICLIIQERAKLTKPDSELAKTQDLAG
jgi:hypothetical protein